MDKESLLLEDLVGSTIQGVRAAAATGEDGDTVFLELSTEVAIGVPFDNLYLVSDSEYKDIWVDFDELLADPRGAGASDAEWKKNPGDYLRLSDLKGKVIKSILTARDDEVGWIYLVLDHDLTLKVAEDQLLADGDYEEIWEDFDRFTDSPALDDART